jgi:hypothetical protein
MQGKQSERSFFPIVAPAILFLLLRTIAGQSFRGTKVYRRLTSGWGLMGLGIVGFDRGAALDGERKFVTAAHAPHLAPLFGPLFLVEA